MVQFETSRILYERRSIDYRLFLAVTLPEWRLQGKMDSDGNWAFLSNQRAADAIVLGFLFRRAC